MNSKLYLLALGIAAGVVFLLQPGSASAEGGCPDGYFPIGGGNGGDGLNYVVRSGTDGFVPGGGGGAIRSGKPNQTGGSGANGRVIITIPSIQVIATSGTLSEYYFTLKEAFDAINAGTHS